MARKVDENRNRLAILVCPKHGEYIADVADSPCPSCEDEDITNGDDRPYCKFCGVHGDCWCEQDKE